MKIVYFRFIESMITAAGRVNARDICDAFGVSPLTAQLKIKQYRQIHDNALFYVGTEKSFKPTENFKRIYIKKDQAVAIISAAKMLFKGE